MKTNFMRGLRNTVASAALLLSSFAMNGCDTTGAGEVEPNPQPKPPIGQVDPKTMIVSKIHIQDYNTSGEVIDISLYPKDKNLKSLHFLSTNKGDIGLRISGQDDQEYNTFDINGKDESSILCDGDKIEIFKISTDEVVATCECPAGVNEYDLPNRIIVPTKTPDMITKIKSSAFANN